MKLAVGGVFPYPAARRAGVAVGLGTDGPGSNDSLDLLADLKLFALAQRHAAGDPTVLPAAEAWRIATGGAARACIMNPPAEGMFDAPRAGAGRLPAAAARSPGARASATCTPIWSTRRAARSVDTTVVAGRVLMRGGEVPGIEEIVARAAERAKRLGIGLSPVPSGYRLGSSAQQRGD